MPVFAHMYSRAKYCILILLFSTPLLANNHPEYNITVSPGTYTPYLPNLTKKIAEQYQLDALSDIVKGNSAAQSNATMGAGTAYAMGDHLFIIGGGGALAVSAVNQTFGEVFDKMGNLDGDTMPRFGVGAQLSALVGMNLGNLRTPRYLGPFELSRTTVFVNVMGFSNSSAVRGLNLSGQVFGAHIQYQLRRAQGRSHFQYGEILFTTGLDYSHFAAKYNSTNGAKELTMLAAGSSSPTDPLLIWKPTGTLEITSGSGTLPIEISTSMRAFYFLSLYVGGAVDVNVGKATTDIHLTAQIDGSTSSLPATPIGTAKLDASHSASPDFLSARAFMGVQLNLVPMAQGNAVSLFVQGNITSIGSLAALVGVRGAW
ncbi:MAG: hypothetical protein LDLANPLL_02792 [Turneriella sp.]|nr:hypothetical protein [Turneriella sp.]